MSEIAQGGSSMQERREDGAEREKEGEESKKRDH